MVDFLHNSCRFFAHESCGQCTPCREGTHWSLMMLERIKAGHGRLSDLDLLLEIGDTIGIIPGTTICGLADGAAWPMKNAIRKFRGEFEEYIRRTNPTGYASTEAAMRCRSERTALKSCNQIRIETPELNTANAQDHHRRNAKSNCPTACASTASRPPSGPASTFRTTAGIRACRSWPVAACAWSKPAIATPRRARSRWCPSSCPPAQCRPRDGTVFVTNSEKVRQAGRWSKKTC